REDLHLQQLHDRETAHRAGSDLGAGRGETSLEVAGSVSGLPVSNAPNSASQATLTFRKDRGATPAASPRLLHDLEDVPRLRSDIKFAVGVFSEAVGELIRSEQHVSPA